VQGSNGEYCYLTLEERVQMVKKVTKHIWSDVSLKLNF
jgi:dihydrodipicolinate synthase/N-acetylneuraminate lyase